MFFFSYEMECTASYFLWVNLSLVQLELVITKTTRKMKCIDANNHQLSIHLDDL